MLQFKQYLSGVPEDLGSQVLDSPSILNPRVEAEINSQLTIELQNCLSAEAGFMKIRKVLSMHGCDMPAVIDLDPEEGEEVFELQQYGVPNAAQRFVYVYYVLNDDGLYDFLAELTDQEGLEELMATDDEDELEED